MSSNVRLPFKVLTYLWLFGFVYALIVGFAGGGRFSSLYDLAIFCLPLLFGAWIVMRPASRRETFAQLTSTLLWLAAVECLYGIYQFVAPPPWDVSYVNELHQVSLGVPVPFGLHPFSLLNSHGMLAVFLVAAILLNLHKLDLRRPWPLVVIILGIVLIMLTNARSQWFALVVGVVAYMVLSPRRVPAFFALAAVGVVAAAFLFNASVVFGSNAGVSTDLQSRFSTLSNVDQDASINGRIDQSSFELHRGLAEPLGQGLGTVGTSVWLEGSSDARASSLVLDNGYISRFLEMGFPGTICYLATVIFSLIFCLRAFVSGLARNDVTLQNIAVAALCIQLAWMGLDLSSDWHSSFAGVLFWAVVGLSLRYEPGDDKTANAWEVLEPPAHSVKRPQWT